MTQNKKSQVTTRKTIHTAIIAIIAIIIITVATVTKNAVSKFLH